MVEVWQGRVQRARGRECMRKRRYVDDDTTWTGCILGDGGKGGKHEHQKIKNKIIRLTHYVNKELKKKKSVQVEVAKRAVPAHRVMSGE